MGLVDSLITSAKTAEETGVMDSAMDYGSARDWLSTVLPNPDEISGARSSAPAWLGQSTPTLGPGSSSYDPLGGWSGDATEFMSRDRLEAWGVPYEGNFEGGNVSGREILERPYNRAAGFAGKGPRYSSQADPSVGWSSQYHGEEFSMGQEVLFGEVSAMSKENPELWQDAVKGSRAGGGYNFSDKQVDALGATYKSFLKKDSPGYKKAASVFNWKD